MGNLVTGWHLQQIDCQSSFEAAILKEAGGCIKVRREPWRTLVCEEKRCMETLDSSTLFFLIIDKYKNSYPFPANPFNFKMVTLPFWEIWPFSIFSVPGLNNPIPENTFWTSTHNVYQWSSLICLNFKFEKCIQKKKSMREIILGKSIYY